MDEQMRNANQEIRQQFVAEVLNLASRDDYQAVPRIVILGLLDVAGHLMKNLAELEPTMLPTLLQQIELLRAHIMPAGGEPIAN